ncbi:MAG: HAD family hydrolase [Candidatus Hermodarchaeota archaeon]
MGELHKNKIIKKFKAILFDFDFTLADSSKGVEQCVSYGFEMLNLPIPSTQEIHKTIGLSLKDTFVKLAGIEYKNKAEAFSQFFIQKADEVMAELTIMFSVVPNIIHLLKNHGYILGIVSTKFRYRIRTILARDDLLESFDVIVGGEDVKTHKPHPESLLLAINILNLYPSQVLYIGDSLTDAETAKRAGISFLPVLSGMASQESFKKYKSVGIIKTLSELPKLLGI